ncbi:ThiF family adenylyltransferase [Candidatus Microgenomates bacterium]|nr:ThiF family adenylyltransferase [Candidatus Microgenomates bacterium]
MSFPLGKSPEYRRQRTIAELRNDAIPSVRLYPLSDPASQTDFISSVKRFGKQHGWTETSDESVLTNAVAEGVLVDNYQYQLTDYAELRRPKGHFEKNPRVLQKYLRCFDGLETGTIVEFPWKTDGRFVHILDREPFLRLRQSRDEYAVPEIVREKLSNMRIAFAGLNVGGNEAYLFLLSGLMNFVVADGGRVDLHSFNRRIGVGVQDIGLNQAVQWMRMAYESNPYADIKGTAGFIVPDNSSESPNAIRIKDFLMGVAHLAEEIDQIPVKFSLWKEALSKGIPVSMGTDMGLSSKIDVQHDGLPFHGKVTPESLMTASSRTDAAIKLVGENYVDPRFIEAIRQAEKDGRPFWPQPGISAFLTAAMAVTLMEMELGGKPVRPETMLNLYQLLSQE